MKLRVAALALGFGLCFANPGLTRNAPIRSVQLRFAPGTVGTTVSGLVTGPDLFACTRTAEAGQHISIDLASANPSISFNLYEPGLGPGKEALVIGEMPDRPNQFDGHCRLPAFMGSLFSAPQRRPGRADGGLHAGYGRHRR
jgi:hypothetical protein